MRNIIFIIIITVIIFASAPGKPTFAANPTPTPAGETTPSATTFINKLKQIETLKEKIATKVAQLRESEKGAAGGTIKSLGDTNITLATKNGDKTYSYSDDTVFFDMRDGEKGEPQPVSFAKKLKVGFRIVIFGYYDTNRTTLSAKYIYVVSNPVHLVGKIADIDKSNYTITVKEAQGNTLVDIETYTRISLFSKKTGIVRSGFSKLSENNTVHIFASPNPKDENRVSALKILALSFANTSAVSPTATVKNSTPSASSKK